MPLTKQQKSELIDKAKNKLKESKTTVFAGFKGVLVEDFKKLRKELKGADADLRVEKKRLFNIALKDSNISFDSMIQKEQLGAVYAKGDLSSVASILYKFAKGLAKAGKGKLTVLGAYEAEEKNIVDEEGFKAIAILPSREILLAQIAMMLTMPLKQVMSIMEQKSKQPTAELTK